MRRLNKKARVLDPWLLMCGELALRSTSVEPPEVGGPAPAAANAPVGRPPRLPQGCEFRWRRVHGQPTYAERVWARLNDAGPGAWMALSDLARHLELRPHELRTKLMSAVDAGVLSTTMQSGVRVYHVGQVQPGAAE
jgi:hypothetical protein